MAASIGSAADVFERHDVLVEWDDDSPSRPTPRQDRDEDARNVVLTCPESVFPPRWHRGSMAK